MASIYDNTAPTLASLSDPSGSNGSVQSADSDGFPSLPDHPSYVVAADSHQVGITGGSILDPSTWGDRATHAMEFSVSALTRAVASTYNSAITVGSLVGLTDDSDKVDTGKWLTAMDDDLGRYYANNKTSIDIFGDVISAIVPGTAGIKVLNWAQKGVALATEGRAGLGLAKAFGVLPTKQAEFAAAAAAEISSSTNTYSLINANLAKSLGTGYLQNALEFAAFDTAASLTMKDSPLFDKHDMSDIALNAFIGGGVVGAGIMGTLTAVRTVSLYRKAGNASNLATHDYRTVDTEPMKATPGGQTMATHLANVESLKALAVPAAGDVLAVAKNKGAADTIATELNNARLASHTLAGSDSELGNITMNVASGHTAESNALMLLGVTKTTRAGFKFPEEAALAKVNSVTGSSTKPLLDNIENLRDELHTLSPATSDYAALAAKIATATDKFDATINQIRAAKDAAGTNAVQYFKLFGDDAGAIMTQPATLKLADTVKSSADIMPKVNSYGHKQGQDWGVFGAADDHIAVESRFIKAQETVFDPNIPVGVRDIPFLESGYAAMTRDSALTTITLKDGAVLDRPSLYHYLNNLKGEESLKLQNSVLDLTGKPLQPADIAKLINVTPEYLVSGTTHQFAPAKDIMAMQDEMVTHTDKMVAQGLYRADKGLIKTYLLPQYTKMLYDTSAAAKLDGHLIDGLTALKEEQQILRQRAISTTNAYFGEESKKFIPRIPGSTMAGANRSGPGFSLLASLNGDYKQLGSVTQEIGKQSILYEQKLADKLAETFASTGHAVLNNDDARLGLIKITQQLRQSGDTYELIAGRGLVKQKQLQHEEALAAVNGDLTKVKLPEFNDPKSPTIIPVDNPALNGWANTWDKYHKEHRVNVDNLRTSQGLNTSDQMSRAFYIPPVDSRTYPHFAFVTDTHVNSTGHMSMIHATDAHTLEAMADKVRTDLGFRVMFKSDSEEWHLALKNYDYELGINENYIDSAMKRSGISAPTFPTSDANKLWNDLMGWRKNQDSGLLHDVVEHRYEPEFAELRRQGAVYDKAENSRTGYVSDILKARTSNPYTDYIKVAHGFSSEGTTPIWSAINRLASTSIDTAVSKISAAMQEVKTSADLEGVNAALKEIGVSTFQDAATYALANHTAPKPALNNFIRGANSLLSFLMLRSDPMAAAANGAGHAVLYGTELPRLQREVLMGGGANAAAMRDLTQIAVPGTANFITSPVKLASHVMGDWVDKVVGGKDGGALYKWAKEGGYLPSYTDQFKLAAESLTLHGTESESKLAELLSTATTATKYVADKMEAISLNRGVEEMNRFRSAVTAKYITDAAIAAGKLDPVLAPSIINTFVNRVEGIHLAAQRPLMFKGAIGQALGLFQTYQFNMLQQLFRYVGEGDRRSVGTLLGLQGSIFGMNGLPAFNAMNTYIVGNAAGNVNHKDLVQTTYDAAGKEAGDWLMYGIASNMLLHPDAKVNLYSRGDINPRQVTVIPTQLADVPIVGATTKFFGSMYETVKKINKGADVWGAFLQGVEHSGISRPLTGLAQVLEATNNPNRKVFSTDNAGNIVMQNDFLSAMTAARLLGAKPLDEAATLDYFYRTQVYNANSRAKVENLGEGIKATVIGGNVPTSQQINTFTSEYMKAGGKQQQFAKFFTRQVLNANKSKVNQMVENANNPEAQYMQSNMGGYELKDFSNDSSIKGNNMGLGTGMDTGLLSGN